MTSFFVSLFPRGRRVTLRTALALSASLLPTLGPSAQGYRISGRLDSSATSVVRLAPSPDGSRIVFSAATGARLDLMSVRADGSDPMQLGTGTASQIHDAKFTADGQRVVFTADPNRDGHFALFAVPIDGSRLPVQLSVVTASASSVDDFAITPDGTNVFYLHNALQTNVPQLFRVPIEGGEPELVSVGGAVRRFELVPAQGRVVYLADDPGTYLVDDLYSVRITGGASLRLDDLVGLISTFQVSADGTRVVYLAEGSQNNDDLYSVPIDFPAPVKIIGPNYIVRNFELGANGRVVYIADQGTGSFELYSAPLDGSAAPARLTLPATSGVFGFRLSAQGTQVAFFTTTSGGTRHLFSASTDGTRAPVELSQDDPFFTLDDACAFSPDGSALAYLERNVGHVVELFVAPADGSQPATKLSGPMVAGGGVSLVIPPLAFPFEARAFEWSADGTRIVYRADQEQDELFELYSVPVDGSQPPLKLNPQLSSGASLFHPAGSVAGFELSPDGSVLFGAAREGAPTAYESPSIELFRVPITRTSAPQRIDPPSRSGPPSNRVQEALFAFDGEHVLYRDSLFDSNGTTLFSIDLQGGAGNIRRVNGDLFSYPDPVDLGGARDVRLVPGGASLLYRASEVFGSIDLYQAPVDGGLPPTRVNSIDLVVAFQLDPAGLHAVYEAASSLYSVPLDGSSPTVRLDGPANVGRTITSFSVGSERATFIEDTGGDRLFELYSAPLDGSQPALKLNAPLVAEGDVVAFTLAADPGWVVYRADQELDQRFELYAVRTDGSQPPVKLSGALVAGGDVLDFQINALGTRVVYRADQDADEVIDLYGVPIDGSSAAVRLNSSAPLADVQDDYQLSHDGLGVVYRADSDTNGQFELFVAPVDGSSAPVKRSGALGFGGQVQEFQISPDDVHLVYRAHLEAHGPLFSVPILGSASPVRLDTSLIAGGGVASSGADGPAFRITSDGSRVVYLGDLQVDEQEELFSRPIDGSGEQRKESGPLVTGGNVLSFVLDATGQRALYRADQDFDGVVELYLSYLQPEPKGRRAR